MQVQNVAALGPPQATQANTGPLVVRTRGLTKRYGKRLAVNNLNLEIRRGEIFGFLGPNGAGKTTTIRMLLGLIAPTSGDIQVLGHDITGGGDGVLPRVGALVETPAIYPYLTGRDNLRAAFGVFGPIDEERVQAVLKLVGLHERQKDRAKTYSLGMKQRLGVAMAMVHDPELLVLDEPANGLDPAGIVEMRDLLRRLAAEGKTVLISSHVLSEIQQICDRVGIINLGQMIREATVADLTRSHGEFRVTVERPTEALALVRAQPWGATAQVDGDGTLVTSAPNSKGRDLNVFLVQAGFPPERLFEQAESLEQVFLRLTGGTPDANLQEVR